MLTSTAISYFTQAFAIPFPVLFGILIAQLTLAPHMSWPPEAQPVLVSDLWIRHLKCFQWRPKSILSPGPSGLYKRFCGLPGANREHILLSVLCLCFPTELWSRHTDADWGGPLHLHPEDQSPQCRHTGMGNRGFQTCSVEILSQLHEKLINLLKCQTCWNSATTETLFRVNRQKQNKRCLLDFDYMINFLNSYFTLNIRHSLFNWADYSPVCAFLCSLCFFFFFIVYHIVFNHYCSCLLIFVILLHFWASCTQIFQCAYVFTGG